MTEHTTTNQQPEAIRVRSKEIPPKGDRQPDPLIRHGAGILEGSHHMMIVVGGRDRHWKKQEHLYSFDIDRQEWKTVVSTGKGPGVRVQHTCSSVNNSLYVFGGSDGKTLFHDVHELQIGKVDGKASWSHLSPRSDAPNTPGTYPSPRRSHSACSLDRCILIFGGFDGKSNLNDVFMFNTETLSWEEMNEFHGTAPCPRRHHSAVVYERKMIIFGGQDDHDAALGDAHILHLDSHRWEPVTSSGEENTGPTGRFWHTASVVGSRMFVIGGSTGVSALEDVWALDLETWRWTRVSISVPRYSHSTVSIDSRLFVFGGYGSGYLKDLLMIDTVWQTPTRRKKHSTIGRRLGLTSLGRSSSSRRFSMRNLLKHQEDEGQDGAGTSSAASRSSSRTFSFSEGSGYRNGRQRSASSVSTTSESPPSIESLQSRVATLEQEVDHRDHTINKLEQQLLQKDAEIEDLKHKRKAAVKKLKKLKRTNTILMDHEKDSE